MPKKTKKVEWVEPGIRGCTFETICIPDAQEEVSCLPEQLKVVFIGHDGLRHEATYALV